MALVSAGCITGFGDHGEPYVHQTMGEINQRIGLWSLKQDHVPTAQEGLQAVYGDMGVPTDSWGNDFVYVVPGPNGFPYDIVSYGADGQPGGSGVDADIRWSELK